MNYRIVRNEKLKQLSGGDIVSENNYLEKKCNSTIRLNGLYGGDTSPNKNG